MSIFSNLKSDGLEEAQDRLGGFQALDTDIYTGKVKVAYAGKSQGGAHNVTIVVDLAGREYRETIYVTNKKGENFFLNKNDPTKKVPLPGFTTIDHICMIAGGAPLADQPLEDKMVKVWDPEEKKEMPKSVPVLVDLIGKDIALGIVKQTVDVNEKNGDEYVPTGKTRDENVIEKVFDVDTKLTVVEAVNGLTEGVFWDSWKEKNKGVTRDRTTKNPQGGQSGRPGRSAGAPPQAGEASKGKSLFGKK